MVLAQRVDFNTLALQGVTSAIAGGALELADRQGQTFSILATVGALAGGVAVKMFGGRDMAQFGDPIFLAGATVGGWHLSQQLLKQGTGAPAFLANRNPQHAVPRQGQQPRSLPAPGRMPQPAQMAARPAARAFPGVSQSGRNTETGEEILFSRV